MNADHEQRAMISRPSVHVATGLSGSDAAALRPDQPATVVIFGATGDLAARKLVPALFNLHLQQLLPEHFSVVAVARRDMTNEAFAKLMLAAVRTHSRTQPVSEEAWARFVGNIHYYSLVFDDAAGYGALAQRLENIEGARGAARVRLFYLATAPSFFLPIIQSLGQAGLVRRNDDQPCCRVVIEKPFGRDLESAVALNRDICRVLTEDHIYRIDHYLGKDTVQNILTFRFGNAIFDPLFNNKYVDHLQITVAESVGMEGRRGQYYDTAGALRDVIQNHGLQLLCLVAMEPPAVLQAKAIRDEKLKVLQSLRPLMAADVREHVVRGQYTAGQVGGASVHPYRGEESVAPQSLTETYVALRLGIDNWRWAGVPFLLRTGKRLAERVTEIVVQFKHPPLHYFTNVECVGEVCDISRAKPNMLIFRIQPDEGISLTFSAKRPGMLLQTHAVEMDFVYDRSFAIALPEAYEHLLLDALRGDSTLFMRSDEVESAWRFVDPVLQAWQADDPPPLCFYPAGTWGPPQADRLLAGCDGQWQTP